MAEPEVLLNLSVNYIPKSVDEFELGSVQSIKWFTDRKTGSNLGYGFIKYRTAKSAADAIKYLNGHNIGTKQLKVTYTKEAEAQQAPDDLLPTHEKLAREDARIKELQAPEYARIKECKRLKRLRAGVLRKVFWPFVRHRVDCAIAVCSTVEAVERVYPHAYPKDVAALTMAMLCGPLPAHAVESALSPLMELVDFTEIQALKFSYRTTVGHQITIFPTSGPRGSVISLDHFYEILIAAPRNKILSWCWGRWMFDENELSTDHEGARERFYQ